MKNYKANVTIKKGKKTQERILWIRKDDIIQALEVTRKVRAIKLNYIGQVSNEQYMSGVANA